MRNAEIREQIIRYHDGDANEKKKVSEEILNENKPLVDYIINKCYSTFKGYYDDLRQVGYIGILEAIPKYDPDKSEPSTFFTFYIKHNLSEYCNRFITQVSSHYANKLKAIRKAKAALEMKNMEVTALNIAMFTGLKVDVVHKILEAELYGQTKNCSSESFMDEIVNNYQPGPEELFEEEEKTRVLVAAINNLPSVEKEVLIRKFGLFETPAKSNGEIAEEVGVPVNQVRRYVQKAIIRLRDDANLKYMFPDYINKKCLMDGELSVAPIQTATAIMEELESED